MTGLYWLLPMWTTSHTDTALTYKGSDIVNGLAQPRTYQVTEEQRGHPDNPRYLKIERVRSPEDMMSSWSFLPLIGWKQSWLNQEPGETICGPVFVLGGSRFQPTVYRANRDHLFRLKYTLHPGGGGGHEMTIPVDLMEQMTTDIQERYGLRFTAEIFQATAEIHPLRETLFAPRIG